MDDEVFQCFDEVVTSMSNLESLKLNINKCNITAEVFYEFALKIGDMDALNNLEIVARKNYWDVKKRDVVYEGFNVLSGISNKKLDF